MLTWILESILEWMVGKGTCSYNPYSYYYRTIIWADGQDFQKQDQIFSLSISTLTEERLEVYEGCLVNQLIHHEK